MVPCFGISGAPSDTRTKSLKSRNPAAVYLMLLHR